MPEQPAKGKGARRPRERQAQPPDAPTSDQPIPTPRPTPAPPPEGTQLPEPPTTSDSSVLREQPMVAYALVFALLVLLLLCAFSIYMATH